MTTSSISIDNQATQFLDDANTLTDYLVEGDDFAVIAEEGNAEGVNYYILRCTKAKALFSAVHGCGHYIHFIQYEWPKVSIHYSHLVLAVKLRLERIFSKKKGSTPYWRLGLDEHESIMETVRSRAEVVDLADDIGVASVDDSYDD
ncbi:hypothetical protein GOP47_0030224 [Adiantum capillus-veneris]|nr:hypothetical protein GOP47_0030224 [Adiantum capillus-veneris]